MRRRRQPEIPGSFNVGFTNSSRDCKEHKMERGFPSSREHAGADRAGARLQGTGIPYWGRPPSLVGPWPSCASLSLSRKLQMGPVSPAATYLTRKT